MALWAALYVNDQMIGHASAQRTEGGERPDDINTYIATVSGPVRWHGVVTHRYGDGGWELMRKVLESASRDSCPGGP
jgi:hypothetical protein